MSRVTPLIATALLVLLSPEEAVAGGQWQRPLTDGDVVRAFAFERAEPFRGGRRRGVDLAGTQGARVSAVCSGRVTYAGVVPGWRRGVTLRCGDGLIATELGLARVDVGRGDTVMPGASVGRLAKAGVLRVGARHAGDRFGWIDPEPLFGEDALPPQVAPAPARIDRRRAPVPRLARVPRSLPAPSPNPLPVPVVLGAGLLAVAAAGGLSVRRGGRRKRPVPEIVVVQR